jgi:hypothetical protein
MPVFTPSTIPWVTAVGLIADSVGASADAEMQTRAHRSLRAAFQHFNGNYKWDFLRTEAAPVTLVAPFSVTGVSASAGQSSAAAPASHGILVDDLIIASGFVLGTRVSATAASGFGFNVVLTGLAAGVNVITASAQRDLYDLPSDWKSVYSLRLLSGNLALRYAGRRAYDRTISDENTASSPYWYDLFRAGSGSKVRILPPPSAADVLLMRYYRRMSLASASGVTSNLDLPEDYESYPIAWAKWHFLVDKGEGRKEQATIWLSLAQEGLKTMLKDQTSIADADLGFMPGASTLAALGDRSTRAIDWDS